MPDNRNLFRSFEHDGSLRWWYNELFPQVVILVVAGKIRSTRLFLIYSQPHTSPLFFTSQGNLAIKAPLKCNYIFYVHFLWKTADNNKCSLFLSCFSSFLQAKGKRKRIVEEVAWYQQNLLDQEGAFEIKGKQWREWLTSEELVFLLLCLIITWHSRCVLHQNAGSEYPPEYCEINRKEQSIIYLQADCISEKIRTIYCVLTIFWSVLCIKYSVQWDELWNALFCCYFFPVSVLSKLASLGAGRKLNLM